MALSKASMDLLASILKVDGATIQAAITDEKEVDIQVPEGLKSFSGDELTNFTKNLDEQGFKRGVDKGKETANEMLIKEIRTSEGLEFEGKTKENLLAALKTKYAGSKEDLVSQFEKDKKAIKSNFKTQLNTAADTQQQLREQLKNKERQFQLFNASPEKLTIKREHASKLFLSDIQWEKDAQDRDIVVLNGKKQVTETLDPIPLDKVYNEWIVENKYVTGEPGRGGGDEGGDDPIGNALADFNKEMATQGINPGSAIYNQKLQEKAAAEPEFKKEVLASE